MNFTLNKHELRTHTLLDSVVMHVCTSGSTSSGEKSHLVAMLSRWAVATWQQQRQQQQQQYI
jgi:hypothetical protein